METLEAMDQHWPIFLLENLLADPDNVFGGNADDMTIKGGVVQRAK
jgi:hypothetical protein